MASERQRQQGTAAAPTAPAAATAQTTAPPATTPTTLLPGTRPYTLRPLLHDVPLSADGQEEDIKINCVDYYGTRRLEAPFRALLTIRSPVQRRQPLCRHQRLRAPPLLPHPSRPYRPQQLVFLYPRFATPPAVFRARRRHQWPAPRCAADPPAATSRQGLCPMQLDRHLLLASRAEPRVWRYTS